MNTKSLVISGVVVAAVAGSAIFLPTAWHSPAIAATPPEPSATTSAPAPASSPPVVAGLPDFSTLVERFGPAVVNITVKQEMRTSARGRFDDPMESSPFAPFFRGLPAPPARPMTGQGSGFIISADGLVLTNAHVVDDADEVTVKLTDKREFTAQVLGKDKLTDVAVLRIDAHDLPFVQFGNPEDLQVGEWVVAIGSPFGFENSVTAGIVSAKGRALPDDTYVPFIQTDVAVNPGNSGGPLFNLRGEVVGINSQIFSRTGGYQGVSFAIPIDVAMRVQKDLVADGHVSRGWLGVGIQGMSRQLAESFGLDQPRGALVSQVMPGSPAATAGLQAGDVILEFGGKAINDSSDLPPLVGATRIGTDVPLKVLRNGKEKNLTAEIARLADDDGGEPEATLGSNGNESRSHLGVAVADLSDSQRAQLGIEHGGVVVTQVSDGPAAEAGIRRGDVLLQLGREQIDGSQKLRELLDKAPQGKPIPILVRRGENTLFLALQPASRNG
ncbi:MAG: DegQ family serine endoprotease [Gammaproteobacteria bacterium]|nr:MAG: DegQ family serine endoprotease [Gammaproteobacteria bacterium]